MVWKEWMARELAEELNIHEVIIIEPDGNCNSWYFGCEVCRSLKKETDSGNDAGEA